MKKSFVKCLVIFLLLAPWPVLAYTETTSGGEVKANVYPGSPGPNETVNISLGSYSADLETSSISWSEDGKTYPALIGQSSFSFTMGSLGSTKEISASITALSGGNIEKNFTFTAGSVDILWEANTYVPPFYQGHSQPSSDSQLKIVAIPHIFAADGQPLGLNQLVFKWQNGSSRLSAGKPGVNYLTIQAEKPGGKISLTLNIYDLFGQLLISKDINIPTSNPQILVYENKPLVGMQYQRALTSIDLSTPEIALQVEPYFFSLPDVMANQLSYNWQMNGRPITASSTDRRQMSFQQDRGSAGTVNVAVLVKDAVNWFQSAQAGVVINLNKKSSF
ncbi:MAG: hypothetical protein AAB645_02130 [Patescibacteria group bacterium]